MIHFVPTELLKIRTSLGSTNIQSRWDCPVRDNILVEKLRRFDQSPVWDDINSNRTIMFPNE